MGTLFESLALNCLLQARSGIREIVVNLDQWGGGGGGRLARKKKKGKREVKKRRARPAPCSPVSRAREAH